MKGIIFATLYYLYSFEYEVLNNWNKTHHLGFIFVFSFIEDAHRLEKTTAEAMYYSQLNKIIFIGFR
jgi:hypothetical protein